MGNDDSRTLGQGGFGKAKLTTYNGKKAVVKYINTTNNPRATLATCTINRKDAKYEGEPYDYVCCLYPAGVGSKAAFIKKEQMQSL